MGIFIFTLEIIGTIAFSISGAVTGMRKGMDVFGIVILGLVTAVGGGIMRDLILGINPPMTFVNPKYALISIITSVLIFCFTYFNVIKFRVVLYNKLLFIMDALGLGVFTVVGVQTALVLSDRFGIFLLIFVGVMTGVGGGVVRDILAKDMPYIFIKHIYASASIAGALVCLLLWSSVSPAGAMVIGAAVVFIIRCLSAYYKWSLPHIDGTFSE